MTFKIIYNYYLKDIFNKNKDKKLFNLFLSN